MYIKFNNELINLPDNPTTVKELLDMKSISSNGTAVAINGKLAPRSRWEVITLSENDDVVVISAAFGG